MELLESTSIGVLNFRQLADKLQNIYQEQSLIT
jgi:hypothetical protein